MNRLPLYLFIASFIAGCGVFSVFALSVFHVGVLIFLGCLSFLRTGRGRFVFALIAVGLLLGGLRMTAADMYREQTILLDDTGHIVHIVGTVVREPEDRPESTRLTVLIDTIDGASPRAKIKLLVYVDRYPQYSYGDEIEFHGELIRPENFEGTGGREFNYIRYLAKDDIYYVMYRPDAARIAEGKGNIFVSFLFSLKHAWQGSIERLLPDPQAALAEGLIVGAEESLGDDLENEFRRTGIIHIVVLSGYNVTIVADAIQYILFFLPRLIRLSGGALFIVGFAILTGASATIVRASIMALIVLLGRAVHRKSEITHSLFIAAFGMVLHEPLIVVYDPSFQLSFLATLGLIYVAPHVERYFSFVSARFKLREFVTATIATQIFVLPLLLYMVGDISLVAPLVNVLVLAFVPMTMLFGFLSGLAGFLGGMLAFPFTAVSYTLLSYELFVVDMFAQFPFASLHVPNTPLAVVCGIYALYVFVLLRRK